MNYKMTPAQVQSAIREKLSHIYGVSAKNASDDEFYKASALVVRDLLVRGRDEFVHEAEKQETKQIYYLCMEFLLGRSLKNNLFNLGLEDSFRKALSEMGVKLDNLYEQEPDAGLGNGGLGRLAACFLDGLATQGYPAMGYSLRYEYGIFRQKLVEGWQTELPSGCRRSTKAPLRCTSTATSKSSGMTTTIPYVIRTIIPLWRSRTICMFPAWTARAFPCCASGVRKPTNLI